MNNKRTIIIVVVLMAVVFFWNNAWDWGLRRLGYDPNYRPPIAASTESTSPATMPTTSPALASSDGSTQPTTAPNISAPAVAIAPATQPAAVTAIGSAAAHDPAFPIQLKLAPEGASVSGVVLNDFKRSVDSADPYVFQLPYDGFESQSHVLATRSVTINGTTIETLNQPWSLIESSRDSATFAIDLRGPDGAPLARVLKRYNLFARDAVGAGSGYEVRVTQTVENKSGKPLDFSTTYNGTNTPPPELDRGSDRSIVGAYENAGVVTLVHAYVEQFGAKQKTKDYTKSEKYDYPMLWAGVSSVYFNAIVRPEPIDDKTLTATHIEKVLATSLNPDASASNQHHIVMTFHTKPLTVAAGESLALSNSVFFGPKQRSLLKTQFYSRLPRDYDATLVMTGGLCGVCTFQWLIDVLVALLKFFHFLLRDWGLAIIALVCLVRLILHPVTKRSQINMSKMSKFGPEIEKLKAKYGDDKDGLNKAMMGFYKEHGATPVLGCLPMFLQTPIWIALWSALQSTFELRQAGFLHFGSVHLTWIKDLSQPDHLIQFAHSFSLFGLVPISGLNLLPLLMGLVFFFQQKFTPKPAVMTPEQAQQQKMMQWMSVLIFPLMLYGGPSGLNLYILTSTCIGILEAKIVRDHIKARDEAEKDGRVIIDAGKKFGRSGGGSKNDQPPAAPKKGLRGMLATLQEKAEQVRREQERRDRGKA